MKKFYFAALLMFVSSLGIFAQESDDSMVIEMQDGSKITLTISEVKEIVFQKGQIIVPGNELLSLTEKLAQMSSRIDSLANVTKKILAERPVAPQVRINSSTYQWEISNDGGITWMSTGVVAKGQDGISPMVMIDPSTCEWMISYDRGMTWVSTGVVAKGQDGKDGEGGNVCLLKNVMIHWAETGGYVEFELTSGSVFCVPLAQ